MLQANYSGKIYEAGLDEAGRGCLAGPVVAAAVILPPDYYHPLLTDSKQLIKEQREILRTEIYKEAVAWAVGEVSHTEIDQINILNASFLAMHRAVAQLAVVPEYLIVDGNRFNPYPAIDHACIVKGDSKYFSIAAASVLAKTYRDDLMQTLGQDYPHFGWEQNAGYPTIKHRAAIRIHGVSPHHRLTFRLLPEEVVEAAQIIK
ncbi:ribonuclease HII [Adhaeribacter aerolatus]|uniref:Ribonuclease HII n=1 Tax=Adhaeribacter aerolatus TaxID=670289 RepID=A0A512AWE5_9BACT|nr:ribonuclease HII [Adhaeribacter aerolatus]GEO04038.1 ribonuclease HII [Adhaeribacter aerolatus]